MQKTKGELLKDKIIELGKYKKPNIKSNYQYYAENKRRTIKR